MHHFLLTRFNLLWDPQAKPETHKHLDDKWLDDREKLFDEYTYPSVKNQRGLALFDWLVFHDPKTPEDRLDKWKRKWPLAEWLPVSRNPPTSINPDSSEVVAHIKARAREDVILTSRIDSDDMIHRDYMAMMRHEAEEIGFGDVLNPPNGYFLNTDGTVGTYSSGAVQFITRKESIETLATVMEKAHGHMQSHCKFVRVPAIRCWCTVCHGGNVMNSNKGNLVTPIVLDCFR